jgi:hypothetical protein
VNPFLIGLVLAVLSIVVPAAILFETFLKASQRFARNIGYLLASIGWVWFSLGIFCLAVAGPSYWIDLPFRWGSWWIVPGWLLLRFAAGLFPFSRRIFK